MLDSAFDVTNYPTSCVLYLGDKFFPGIGRRDLGVLGLNNKVKVIRNGVELA